MSAIAAFSPRVATTEAERQGAEITELCGCIAVATCHLLELIREFDACRYREEQGFRSCSEWLGFHCGFGPVAAREHLRVAKSTSSIDANND